MRAKDFIKNKSVRDDYDPNDPPPGPEFKPTMPAGTVRVDVSDVYDWYKLGKFISNLKQAKASEFGKGPPSTILSFGSEEEEHKYINALKKLGLTTTDIDPVDPKQPKGMPRQKVDPTYNVGENMDHEKDDQSVPQLKTALLARKEKLQSATDDQVYDVIDTIMTRIAKAHGISGQKLHDMWVEKYGQIPDTWIMKENFADGKNPQDKGDSKRHGINTKASVSSLRKTAKQGGRKGQLAHWLANMKAGKAKKH